MESEDIIIPELLQMLDEGHSHEEIRQYFAAKRIEIEHYLNILDRFASVHQELRPQPDGLRLVLREVAMPKKKLSRSGWLFAPVAVMAVLLMLVFGLGRFDQKGTADSIDAELSALHGDQEQINQANTVTDQYFQEEENFNTASVYSL